MDLVQPITDIVVVNLLVLACLFIYRRYQTWLQVHWPHKTMNWLARVAIPFGLTGIVASVAYAPSSDGPKSHEQIAAPNIYALAPSLILFFFATLLTLLFFEKGTRVSGTWAFALWACLGAYVLGIDFIR